MSEIKKRILQYLDIKHVTDFEFSNRVGMSHGILKRDTGISEENLNKFINEYPEVDVKWLITGDDKDMSTTVKAKIEQSKNEAKVRKSPSRNAKKLDAIYNEMKEMLVEMKDLKENLGKQKEVINSISKQLMGTENIENKVKSKRKSKIKLSVPSQSS